MKIQSQKTKLTLTPTSPIRAGIALFTAITLAFILVNSGFSTQYELIHHAPMSVQIGELIIAKPMIAWINEGLMVFFFFLIGLEIKREVYEGQLSSIKQVALPAFAAVGGMIAPALIYLLFNWSDPVASQGWAIPAATDIVLALAFLALLGNRVPVSLKVFLTALAIFDDFGTLVIIALFYTESLSMTSILFIIGGVGALVVLNRLEVTRITAYMIVGLILWVAVLKSGVHATLAGVIVAWSIPMRVQGKEVLKTMEHDLTPWVTFGVVPVFAFFNAGINISGVTTETLLSPISLGIVLGLFIGKQLGVFVFARLAVWSGFAHLPTGVSWLQLYGVSALAGIGFTMSLFVAALTFEEPGAILSTNLSIVIGSLCSAILGMVILSRTYNKSVIKGDANQVPIKSQGPADI